MFSDTYKIKLIDNVIYEVYGKVVSRGGEDIVLAGSNPSAEEADEGTDATVETGVDVVLNSRLVESFAFGTKKDFTAYLKDYMKKWVLWWPFSSVQMAIFFAVIKNIRHFIRTLTVYLLGFSLNIPQIDSQIGRKCTRPSWRIQDEYEQANEGDFGSLQRLAILHRRVNGLWWYGGHVRISWCRWYSGASVHVLQTRSWRREILDYHELQLHPYTCCNDTHTNTHTLAYIDQHQQPTANNNVDNGTTYRTDTIKQYQKPNSHHDPKCTRVFCVALFNYAAIDHLFACQIYFYR